MLGQTPDAADESQLVRIEAMIRSMTPEERQRPKIINGMRRSRIAKGSGRTVQEVNALIKQWGEMNRMMGKIRAMANGGDMSPKAMKRMMNQMAAGATGAGKRRGGANPYNRR